MCSPETMLCYFPWSPFGKNGFCGNKSVSNWVVLEFHLGLLKLRSVTVPEVSRNAKLICSTGSGESTLLLLLPLHGNCLSSVLHSKIAMDSYCS